MSNKVHARMFKIKTKTIVLSENNGHVCKRVAANLWISICVCVFSIDQFSIFSFVYE